MKVSPVTGGLWIHPRRAFDEPEFQEMLLTLPDNVIIRASVGVMRDDYGKALTWVRQALTSKHLPLHPILSHRLLIGDSMIRRYNLNRISQDRLTFNEHRADKDRDYTPLEPGDVAGFKVVGISGAGTSVVAFITQAMTLPTPQVMVWFVGTNDLELTPIPSKYDRRTVEKENNPNRKGRFGAILPGSYPQVAHSLMYHGRVVQKVRSGYDSPLYMFEIMPRFHEAPEYHLNRHEYRDEREPRCTARVRKLNDLLWRLAPSQQDLRIMMVNVYARTDNPDYFRETTGVRRLQLRIQPRHLWYPLWVQLVAVRDGENARALRQEEPQVSYTQGSVQVLVMT